MKIRKAVIAVAGFGTRFLPATKAQPKEMLPVIDKPVIQYIVEDAVSAGIETIVFITSANKRAIEDHFDSNFELEYLLKKKKKNDALKQVKKISDLADFVYIRQKSPRGWGDAILQAEKVIGNEPFIYTHGDDLYKGKKSVFKQVMDVYERYGDGVLGVREVPKKEAHKYGVIGGTQIKKGLFEVNKIVEKPSKGKEPSNYAVFSPYLFTPDIFDALKKTSLWKGELVGTHAIAKLLKKKPFYAKLIEDDYYDCGNKLGFLKATVDFALARPEFKKEFKEFLKTKV